MSLPARKIKNPPIPGTLKNYKYEKAVSIAVDKNIFSLQEVLNIIKLPQRTIINWAEKGVIIPFKNAAGPGRPRLYDYKNLIEFGICKALVNMGFEHWQRKKIMNNFRSKGRKYDDCLLIELNNHDRVEIDIRDIKDNIQKALTSGCRPTTNPARG